MPRIAHKTPMAGYDHIANLLQKAGGKDGIISRDDADRLVEDLKKEGKGTEALAAQNLFKMIDSRDAGAGSRVTSYDLNLTRTFVESRMLENRDTNHNGYSKAEIAKMSPTGQALVELGQVLAMSAHRGRISHSVPEAGLNHIAKLIKASTGGDGVISRADKDALIGDLYRQGRGTEALAAANFFSFVDHRDSGDGARVTANDIDRAVDYANAHLLENKDANHNGYDQSEVANFSKSAKAFLLLGQMIEAGLIK